MKNNNQSFPELAFQFLILTSGAGLLACGVTMCFLAKGADVIAMTYTSGLMCFVFAYLPLFQKFKGMGVEAEMKDEDTQNSN